MENINEIKTQSVAGRLIEYAKIRKQTPEWIENIIGYPLSKVDSANHKALSKICEKFPDLNYEWLVTGKGAPLKNVAVQTSQSERAEISQQIYHTLELRNIVHSQKELAIKLGIDIATMNQMIKWKGFSSNVIGKIKEILVPDLNTDYYYYKKGQLFITQETEIQIDVPDYENMSVTEQLQTANRLNDGLMLQNQALIEELQRQGKRIDMLLALIQK